jgi:peptidoglycan/xylan/chitin deacetylase (PgdA/CDA1 family)
MIQRWAWLVGWGWLPRVLGAPLASALQLALRWTGLKAGVALVYHRVADDPGPAEGHLAACHRRGVFEAQLRHLRARYRAVPASELLAAVGKRRRGERFPVAITFDDDLRSHVEISSPTLRALGIRATFFLSGGSAPFWWERLQSAFDAGVPMTRFVPELEPEPAGAAPHVPLHTAAKRIELMTAAERDEVAALLEREVPERPGWAGLASADARALAGDGHELGFHTRRHDRLPELDDPQLALALGDGREEVADAAGGPITSVAYPHGKADARVAAAARAAGYAAGFTTVRAPATPEGDPLLLGRLEPSFISRGHLALQTVRLLLQARSERRRQPASSR